MKKPNISLYKTVSIVCMAASALLAFLPTAVLFLFRLFGWEIPIGI